MIAQEPVTSDESKCVLFMQRAGNNGIMSHVWNMYDKMYQEISELVLRKDLICMQKVQ